ncbi:hypothetical protein RCL1_008193 [Eukaryota sp. TZLM3-RCL]
MNLTNTAPFNDDLIALIDDNEESVSQFLKSCSNQPFLFCGPSLICLPSPQLNLSMTPMIHDLFLNSKFLEGPGFVSTYSHKQVDHFLSPHPYLLVNKALELVKIASNVTSVSLPFIGENHNTSSFLYFSSINHLFLSVSRDADVSLIKEIYLPWLNCLYCFGSTVSHGFVGFLRSRFHFNQSNLIGFDFDFDFPHFVFPNFDLLSTLIIFKLISTLNHGQILKLSGLNFPSEFFTHSKSTATATAFFENLAQIGKNLGPNFGLRFNNLIQKLKLYSIFLYSSPIVIKKNLKFLNQIFKFSINPLITNSRKISLLSALGFEIISLLQSILQSFNTTFLDSSSSIVFDFCPFPLNSLPPLILIYSHFHLIVPYFNNFQSTLHKSFQLFYSGKIGVKISKYFKHDFNFPEFFLQFLNISKRLIIQEIFDSDDDYATFLISEFQSQPSIKALFLTFFDSFSQSVTFPELGSFQINHLLSEFLPFLHSWSIIHENLDPKFVNFSYFTFPIYTLDVFSFKSAFSPFSKILDEVFVFEAFPKCLFVGNNVLSLPKNLQHNEKLNLKFVSYLSSFIKPIGHLIPISNFLNHYQNILNYSLFYLNSVGFNNHELPLFVYKILKNIGAGEVCISRQVLLISDFVIEFITEFDQKVAGNVDNNTDLDFKQVSLLGSLNRYL